MRDQALDEYHDLKIENGNFVVIDGAAEIAQAVRVRLLTCKYEWWLDPTIGPPWNHGMFWAELSREQKEIYIRQEIMKVAGVTSIKKLVYTEDRDNRSVLIEVELESEEGPVTTGV